MSDRKLASIRRIAEIREIPGADNIVCAVVDGWELVTQKSNNFREGDLVVYFEIDSVLPEREEFEFLRDRCYVSAERSVNGAGFRLKTIKLRGQVSQGLILPINEIGARECRGQMCIYVSDETHGMGELIVEEGLDLTEILGVVKYEKPLPANLSGIARGNFPTFVPKTDQERIQNCFRTLENKWIDHLWEVTMKLDGSSFTAYYRTHPDLSEGQFGVCSRNLDLQETEGNAFWQAARKYNLEENLRLLGRSVAIQGELMGPGIQGNKEKLTELSMFVFDIYDIDNKTYVDAYERYDLCEKLDLPHVPLIEDEFKFDKNTLSKDAILEMADGPSLFANLREGIVFKSRTDPNVSFKAISNKWLLKFED